MDFKKFNRNSESVLEDEFVRLSLIKKEDVQLLYHHLDDDDIFKLNLTPMKTPQDMENYFATTTQKNLEGKDYPFLVYDKRRHEYAGTTRFYEINEAYKTLVIGYTWYGTKFHGTGLNKHCKFLLLQCAFETLDMERVELRADARNERSIYAMKSIGCQVEGVLRKQIPLPDGTRRDTIVLSILRDEWYNSVQKMLLSRL